LTDAIIRPSGREVFPGSHVWLYEYEVNGYLANAIALHLDQGALAIVSPPTGLSEADFATIDAKGQIAALIAPHSGHDLGQAEWQARYPNAIAYASTTALSQLKPIARKPFLPLSKLSATTAEFREVPGTKKGGTIVISRQGERPVVYLDELVINWSSLPRNWTKILFWLWQSAPGLKINHVYASLLCLDLSIVAETVLAALIDDPVIIPAHGTPLLEVGDVVRVRSLVKSLTKSIVG
jgi:hypothetical protein